MKQYKYSNGSNKPVLIFSIIFILVVGFFTARWLIPHGKKHVASATKVTEKAKNKIISAKPVLPVVIQPKPSEKSGGEPKMAIILDDWGQSSVLLERAIAIKRPLTLAVIPHLSKSRDIAEKAKANGLGVMLHMPMQPKGKKQATEPHMILTTSSEAQIIQYLKQALESVPYVQGVNNHQGSAATSDERVMRIVLTYLKKKGLFFIDSHVIASSVAGKVAEEVGIRFEQRDVFIDNQPAVEAVMAKLKEAEHLALAHGRVVVIGHDKKNTLEAIRQMVPEIEKNGIQLVLIRDLVE